MRRVVCGQDYLTHRRFTPLGADQETAMGWLRIDGATSLDDR